MAAFSSLSTAGPAAVRPICVAVGGSELHLVAVGLSGRGVAPVWSGSSARQKARLAATGKHSPPEAEEVEVEGFSSRLEDMRGMYSRTLRAVGDGTADDFAQGKLQGLAESSVALAVDVADRLKPPMGSALDKGLWETAIKFTGVAESARAKLAPWGFANALCNDLDGLRAMVSSATNTPLPGLARETDPKEMQIGCAQVALLAVVEARYAAVAADIKAMLG